MLELPEAITIARQLNDTVMGRTVRRVLPPTKPHRFCWFNGDPAQYEGQLIGGRISSTAAFGIFAELCFDNGMRLCINDGVNVRLLAEQDTPKEYQLLIVLDGGLTLAFTVAMYGGIVAHDGGYDNEYYRKSRTGISPLSAGFEQHYAKMLADSRPSLSAKAFLATEQRFPGLGNGTLQDILFAARIHPKRKLATLSPADKEGLCFCAASVMREMTDRGGRDTEKDLFGNTGGYITKMSRHALAAGCPVCGGPVTKEAYLGGSVYYCAACQPL